MGVHDLNFNLHICDAYGFDEHGVTHERGKTLFAQVMKYVPWKTFDRIIERHGGYVGVRTPTPTQDQVLQCNILSPIFESSHLLLTFFPSAPPNKNALMTRAFFCTKIKLTQSPLPPAL